MSKTVIGSFADQHSADQVVQELEHHGVSDKKISVIARHDGKTQKGHPTGHGTHDLSSGIGWGAAAGGTVGLLASAGALAIPGIGPILAMGPLAATLTGAAAGGLVGGLMDYGIPRQESEHLEADVKKGNVLVMVQTDEHEVERAKELFQHQGAHEVYVH